jgi:hypothetical protein
MKYTKCPICDVKLKNGVCPMCGYDFKRLKSSGHSQNVHWDVLKRDTGTKKPVFVHDEKKCHKKQKKIRSPKAKKYDYGEPKKKKGRLSGILAVLVILAGIVPDLLTEVGPDVMNVVSNVRNEIEYKISGEKPKETLQDSSESNPYRNVRYKLKKEGQHYKTRLSAGEYIVGVDLPEGIYTVSVQKGKSSLMIRNKKQSISEYDFYDAEASEEDDFYKQSKEIHLYEGSYVKLDYSGVMEFETDCAQKCRKPAVNSLKKEIVLKGEQEAGKDFPEGSYDMICSSGRGMVMIKYKPGTDSYEYSEDYNLQAKGAENSSLRYPWIQKQVYFYKGMKIIPAKDMQIKLVPSKYTIPKDAEVYRYYEQVENSKE